MAAAAKVLSLRQYVSSVAAKFRNKFRKHSEESQAVLISDVPVVTNPIPSPIASAFPPLQVANSHFSTEEEIALRKAVEDHCESQSLDEELFARLFRVKLPAKLLRSYFLVCGGTNSRRISLPFVVRMFSTTMRGSDRELAEFMFRLYAGYDDYTQLPRDTISRTALHTAIVDIIRPGVMESASRSHRSGILLERYAHTVASVTAEAILQCIVMADTHQKAAYQDINSGVTKAMFVDWFLASKLAAITRAQMRAMFIDIIPASPQLQQDIAVPRLMSRTRSRPTLSPSSAELSAGAADENEFLNESPVVRSRTGGIMAADLPLNPLTVPLDTQAVDREAVSDNVPLPKSLVTDVRLNPLRARSGAVNPLTKHRRASQWESVPVVAPPPSASLPPQATVDHSVMEHQPQPIVDISAQRTTHPADIDHNDNSVADPPMAQPPMAEPSPESPESMRSPVSVASTTPLLDSPLSTTDTSDARVLRAPSVHNNPMFDRRRRASNWGGSASLQSLLQSAGSNTAENADDETY
eukprot:TRINITY_DN11815_c0_g1_i1.p1 TRINITY_DN11815_c0_g1~~TRINITY_DN11815_c0_g1_i1.p1  ORF type:complete len:544 (-),score=102.13 TRINITY_DN11815_c0_g1_i1:143-1720(-)